MIKDVRQKRMPLHVDFVLDDVERPWSHKLASLDVPTRDNIHQYQCNNLSMQ